MCMIYYMFRFDFMNSLVFIFYFPDLISVSPHGHYLELAARLLGELNNVRDLLLWYTHWHIYTAC
jgi:hypothetical protein